MIIKLNCWLIFHRKTTFFARTSLHSRKIIIVKHQINKKMNNTNFPSLKKLALSMVAACLTLPAMADEGMWLLPLLKQQKYADLQALGLRLTADEVYNANGPSLKDVVVRFGGGCTGEIVSKDGLVLTNHHCGYSSIQRHSTLEHDYLTDGFWAMSRAEELPNPGLTVAFIDRIDDVTDYVLADWAKKGDPNSMGFLDAKYLNELARKKAGESYLKKHPGIEVEIKAFYGGNVYYMFTKKVYSDVRLVGAPPSSIGKFGADTDNWIWPRHTGDFSLFRVYADANGEPAPYSADNEPLRPKRWLTLSTKGVQENDFAMIMGFPGRTNKYYTSWEVAERRDIDNRVRIAMRETRQQAMLEEMLADPQVRIQYASKYSSSTNAYKNAIGSSWAIGKRNFEQVKADEQNKLIAWEKQRGGDTYANALKQIEQMVEARKELRFRSWMLDEALMRGIECSRVPTNIDALCQALDGGKNKKELPALMDKLQKDYKAFANKDYAVAVDRKVAKVMLKAYRKWMDNIPQPAYLSEIDQQFKGDVDAFVDNLFDHSIFGSDTQFDRFRQQPTAEALRNDPMIRFASSIKAEKKSVDKELNSFDTGYALAHRTYVKGLLEMYGDRANFPDANSTLRLAYGQVKGYSPKDADYYGYQTTLDGVMEKEDPNNWEFVVADRLKELYKAKDFGRYQTKEGKMPVAFCATTHTTGGNSGSPVMDADGALIGINFDRNWEGVGGDIQYLPDYQRSIIVDVRYVLFLIDKFAGAGYLLDEMDLK